MKWFALAIWMGLSVPALMLGQNQSAASPADGKKQSESARKDEEQVLAAIRGRLEANAKRDFAAWARFVSDDMIAPLGATKQGWLKEHGSWPSEVKYWYGPLEDVRVHIFGDTAVVAYHSKQFNEMGGQTTYSHKWQIETHMRRGQNWVLVGGADGLIPLEPVAVKVDPRIYDAYVGQYEWGPTLISTITREGDRLMEQFNGPEKSELLPENETTFFVKGEAASGDSSRLIFVKDATGRVTHYIYRELGGMDRAVKKIK
jgi:ketosteroid isomerase-like protein